MTRASSREGPSMLLCHQPVDGGVGRHVADIARGMASRGWAVTTCGPSQPDGLVGIGHIELDMGRAVRPAHDARACAGLARVVGRENPDLIHAHSSKAGALARIARTVHPGVPVLYTPHGYAFAGHFSRQAERHAYRLAERALAPLTTRVICVCEAEARLARSIGKAGRVRVVHNGVEPSPRVELDSATRALGRDGRLLGALTQLRPGKGLETLIDAMAEVHGRHRDVHLAIAGEGPELEALHARADRAGVGGAVSFVGACSEPLAFLAALDVFVHPSWAESLPYVVLEAMSLARAVVATDVGGIGEAVENGSSGKLVAAGDHTALARAVCGLLDDPGEGRRMGEQASARVRERFSTEAMIARLGGVYDEIVPSEAVPARRSQTMSGTPGT